MSGTRLILPRLQFFDSDGSPLSGGMLYTYTAGTTTPLATYSDSALSVPNANPVVLDSDGRPGDIYGDPDTAYKITLTDSDGSVIWTADNIYFGGQVGTNNIEDGAITGVKLDSDIVDDSTIEISSNTLQLKDSGITLGKLGDGSGVLIQVDVYTSDDTWTKPSGCTQAEVWVVGGGGGGGYTDTSMEGGNGGGGGGGSYKFITSGLGATETVTVGAGGTGGIGSTTTPATAGGTSSFGSHCSATGGSLGTSSLALITGSITGGAGSGGDLNVTGGYSKGGAANTTDSAGVAGHGGDAPFGLGTGGSGGSVIAGSTFSTGYDGNGYGSGGGGAMISASGSRNGGDGADGIVIVKSYK